VTPDDVGSMAVPVLAHRVKLRQGARLKNVRPEGVVDEIVAGTAIPIADRYVGAAKGQPAP
jgi:MoxR-like ATPase